MKRAKNQVIKTFGFHFILRPKQIYTVQLHVLDTEMDTIYYNERYSRTFDAAFDASENVHIN